MQGKDSSRDTHAVEIWFIVDFNILVVKIKNSTLNYQVHKFYRVCTTILENSQF